MTGKDVAIELAAERISSSQLDSSIVLHIRIPRALQKSQRPEWIRCGIRAPWAATGKQDNTAHTKRIVFINLYLSFLSRILAYAPEFLVRSKPLTLGSAPNMTERISQPSVTVTPEHSRWRHRRTASFIDSSLVCHIYIGNGDLENAQVDPPTIRVPARRFPPRRGVDAFLSRLFRGNLNVRVSHIPDVQMNSAQRRLEHAERCPAPSLPNAQPVEGDCFACCLSLPRDKETITLGCGTEIPSDSHFFDPF